MRLLLLLTIFVVAVAAGWRLLSGDVANTSHPSQRTTAHRVMSPREINGREMMRTLARVHHRHVNTVALQHGMPEPPKTSPPYRDALSVMTPAPHHMATAAASPPAPPATPSVPPAAGASPTTLSSPGHLVTSGRLAIIIDDCGQWLPTERAIIALPIPLTMSIMPRAPFSSVVERDAAAAGQGIMLHLPMEPLSGKAAGAGEITTAMTDAAIAAAVRADLERVPLARGVNNHEGSKATSDARVMRDVAAVLSEEGRYFVDSRTTKDTVAADATVAAGVPTASRNVFLDDADDVRSVEAQLQRAADVARTNGVAIAIGHPRAATLAALRREIPALQAAGVQFVLAQDLVVAATRPAR